MNEPKPEFSTSAYLFPHINREGIKFGAIALAIAVLFAVFAKGLYCACKSAKSDSVQGINFKETCCVTGFVFKDINKLCNHIVNVAQCKFVAWVVNLQRQAVCHVIAECCHNCVVVWL